MPQLCTPSLSRGNLTSFLFFSKREDSVFPTWVNHSYTNFSSFSILCGRCQDRSSGNSSDLSSSYSYRIKPSTAMKTGILYVRKKGTLLPHKLLFLPYTHWNINFHRCNFTGEFRPSCLWTLWPKTSQEDSCSFWFW